MREHRRVGHRSVVWARAGTYRIAVGSDGDPTFTGAVTSTGTPYNLRVTGTGDVALGGVVAVRHIATCTPTPFGSTPVSFTSFTLQPGATTEVCVEVQLKSTAPANVQGLALGFTAPLDGIQVRP